MAYSGRGRKPLDLGAKPKRRNRINSPPILREIQGQSQNRRIPTTTDVDQSKTKESYEETGLSRKGFRSEKITRKHLFGMFGYEQQALHASPSFEGQRHRPLSRNLRPTGDNQCKPKPSPKPDHGITRGRGQGGGASYQRPQTSPTSSTFEGQQHQPLSRTLRPTGDNQCKPKPLPKPDHGITRGRGQGGGASNQRPQTSRTSSTFEGQQHQPLSRTLRPTGDNQCKPKPLPKPDHGITRGRGQGGGASNQRPQTSRTSSTFEGQQHQPLSRTLRPTSDNQCKPKPPPRPSHGITRGRERDGDATNQSPRTSHSSSPLEGRRHPQSSRTRRSFDDKKCMSPQRQDHGITRGRGRDGGVTNRGSSKTPMKGNHTTTRRHITFKQLKEILSKEPAEVLLELSTDRNGFNELLNQDKLSMDLMALILTAVAEACRCTSAPNNLRTFLASVWHSQFVQFHLQHFVICLPTGRDANNPDAIDEKPVGDLVTLSRALLQHFPSSNNEVGVLLILLESTITSDDESQHKVPPETVSHIVELKEIYETIASQRVNKSTKPGDNVLMDSQNLTPPDDFRSVQIVPNINELRDTNLPFLRQNLIKGKYTDTKHYLDVQFRLLREDFVAPLREGISEYLEHQDPYKRLQDMKLYYNVRIIRRSLTHTGLAHLIRFDTGQFKGMKWESTKRLIHGSLVCLTSDNFESVIFATVEKREVEDLQDGFVVVKFVTEDAPATDRKVRFLMAETSAYYEAYRHNLRGLQEFDQLKFPFQSYIVDASADESPPRYLRSARPARYDLRILCKSSGDSETAGIHSLVTEHDNILRSVDVSQPGQWFNPEILSFDNSQLKAYQAALSKEFVLIQGPPGTGKTFVGLKIVKTLLFNFHSWCRNLVRKDVMATPQNLRPMLIVCYTNHALDQFLEGIYEFEESIVRVGGRRSSDILEPCGLANIRQRIRKEKKLSRHVHGRRSDIRRKHYEVRKSLEIAEAHLHLAQKGILRVHSLYKYMDETHGYDGRSLSRGRWKSLMCSWLGLHNDAFQRDINHIASAGAADIMSPNGDIDDKIHIMDEAEILAERRVLEDNHYLRDTLNEDGEIEYSPLSLIRLDFEFLPVYLSGQQNYKPTKAEHRTERLIALAINNPDAMTEQEARAAQNLWKLPYQQRWRLYRYWLMGYIRQWEKVLLSQSDEYEQLTRALKETDSEEDYLILRSARVIGMTTTGAAKYRGLLQRLHPPIIVVEEAAEVLEAHVITTLSKRCEHLILIGDHQQLRPNPTVYRLAKDFNLDVSLFERMINNGLPCYRLGLQHRMRPEISTIMKQHFYTGLDDHTSVLQYKDVLGICPNMFFVEHEESELKVDDSRSKSNLHEAKFLVNLCRYILKQGYERSQVTILTTYTGQLSNFRKLMDKKIFDGVRVTVVDNFQGEENDIILLSLVRSNDVGSVGFLKVANRVCVALSRAKEGLFCIGNMKLLAKKSPLWKDIVMTLKEKNQIGPALPLGCQNHPETVTRVSCGEDFKKVPEGGCMRPCEARLECGHSCTLLCHPFDPNHEEFMCQKNCSRKCQRGHQCPLKCYRECKCLVLVLKTFDTCYHTAIRWRVTDLMTQHARSHALRNCLVVIHVPVNVA